jgi:hypothetical protein
MYKLFKDDTKRVPKQTLGEIVKINLKSTGEDNVEAKADKVYTNPKVEGTGLPANIYQVQQYASGIPKQDKRLNDKTKSLNGANYTTRKIVPFEPKVEFYKKRPDERSELEEMMLKARIHKVEEEAFKRHLMEQNRFNEIHHKLIGKRLKNLESKLDKEISRVNNLPIPDEQKKSLMDEASKDIINEMNRLGKNREDDPVNKFLEKSYGFTSEDLVNAESKLSIYDDNMRQNAEMVGRLESDMQKLYEGINFVELNEPNPVQKESQLDELNKEFSKLSRQRELLLRQVQGDEAKRNRLREAMETMKIRKAKLVRGETGLSTAIREYQAEDRLREIIPKFNTAILELVDEDLREKTDTIRKEIDADGGAVVDADVEVKGIEEILKEDLSHDLLTEFKTLGFLNTIRDFMDDASISALSLKKQEGVLRLSIKQLKPKLEAIRKAKENGMQPMVIRQLNEDARRIFDTELERVYDDLQKTTSKAKVPALEMKEAVAEAVGKAGAEESPAKSKAMDLLDMVREKLEGKEFKSEDEALNFLRNEYLSKGSARVIYYDLQMVPTRGGGFNFVIKDISNRTSSKRRTLKKGK